MQNFAISIAIFIFLNFLCLTISAMISSKKVSIGGFQIRANVSGESLSSFALFEFRSLRK